MNRQPAPWFALAAALLVAAIVVWVRVDADAAAQATVDAYRVALGSSATSSDADHGLSLGLFAAAACSLLVGLFVSQRPTT